MIAGRFVVHRQANVKRTKKTNAPHAAACWTVCCTCSCVLNDLLN